MNIEADPRGQIERHYLINQRRVWVCGGKRYTPFLILLVIAALIASSGTYNRVEAARTTVLKLGDRAPDANLVDLDGKKVILPGDLKGKVAIIHFWASYCCALGVGGGIPALEIFERFYNEFKGKGLIIAAINVGQTPLTVKHFVNEAKVSYLVLLDFDLKMTENYGCLDKRNLNIPQTFILDRDGIIKYKILGALGAGTEGELRKLIQSLI